MQAEGAIWLGDYLRAIHQLEADEADSVAIRRLLKLEKFEDTSYVDEHWLKELQNRSSSISQQQIMPNPTSHSMAGGSQDVWKKSASTSDSDEATLPAELTDLPGIATDLPMLFAAVPPLPEENTAQPSLEPVQLFPPMQTRGILSRVLARRSNIGPWDLREIVKQSARNELLSEVPRLPAPSLARGVQLLLDRSPALAVYSEDQKWLQRQIQKVVGRDKVSILHFDSNPLEIHTLRRGLRTESYIGFHLPPPGTVVAVLSDLGIGMPVPRRLRAQLSDWLEFADHLRSRGCPVVAFVPYAPRRWPEELRSRVTVVHWDWVTNTASIHAAAGKGLNTGRR